MHFDFKMYSIDIAGPEVSVFLGDRRYMVLKIGSSIDTLEAEDTNDLIGEPEITRSGALIDVSYLVENDLWEKKTYHLHFEADLFWYEIKITGSGRIRNLRYFTSHGGSFFDFSRFFTPECAFLDQRYYRSMQYGCIDATTGKMSDWEIDPYASMHWIFTPPPFCYSLGYSSGPWLGAGIAPRRGEYNFTKFEYVPSINSFCFRLAYDGMTEVDGEWTSPRFVFTPGEDEYEALDNYCQTLRDGVYIDENHHKGSDWWSRPMFCGWGEQNIRAVRSGQGKRSSHLFATQENYDDFLRIIKEKRLGIGTIVIDDKWQKHYGTCEVDTTKWPDLRGWIDERHSEGRKVLLWFGAWNPEGLLDDECLKDSEGKNVCIDPTSPAYQNRIKDILYRILSSDPGCCNADGIKLDWTNNVPIGEGWSFQGEIWGVELLKSLISQIYEAAKSAQNDALVITHTANPYFAECTDMIRLNDIYRASREITSMMRHRAKIGRVACPQTLIDCDNSSAPSHTEWLEYMLSQPEIGVPSLYFLTAVDGTMEEITDEDWNKLAHIWRNSEQDYQR